MTIDVLKTISMDSKCVTVVPVRQSVRRSLFGKVNHDESLEFLRKELDAIAESQKKRWNFDFQDEKPLEPCNYEWTPVKVNDIVPRPYALSRLPYLYEHTESSTACDQQQCLPTNQSQSRSQVTKTKLKQTLIDGYIKSKKRAATISTNETNQKKFKSSDFQPTNKKLCLTPKKTQD